MSEHDHNPHRRKPEHLLDELESIKGLLGDDDRPAAAADTDIPLLDDIVIEHLDDNARLLDLGRIFDDGADDARPATHERVQFPQFELTAVIIDDAPIAPEPAAQPSAPPTATSARSRRDYRRELLIQEVVDELVPQIEAALRERLSGLDDDALRQLLDD